MTSTRTHYFDIGNHHFPSVARTALAQRLVESAPAAITKVAFGSGGGEAIDIAIKSARHATQRRKIVSIVKAYHGHTGLAVATGDDRFASIFLADRPDEFVHVPFNDVDAMEQALSGRRRRGRHHGDHSGDVGIPDARPGYLESVQALAKSRGALHCRRGADRPQRTGEMWAITKHGIEPDIMVTGKGLSGGMYPISAAMLNERAANGSTRTASRHISTFGGAELGCAAGSRPWRSPAAPRSARWCTTSPISSMRDCAAIQAQPRLVRRYPAKRAGDRSGVRPPARAPSSSSATLRERGLGDLLALDPRVLQFKPGILLGRDLCEDVLDRLDVAVRYAHKAATERRRPGRAERREEQK